MLAPPSMYDFPPQKQTGVENFFIYGSTLIEKMQVKSTELTKQEMS